MLTFGELRVLYLHHQLREENVLCWVLAQVTENLEAGRSGGEEAWRRPTLCQRQLATRGCGRLRSTQKLGRGPARTLPMLNSEFS